MKLVVAIIRPEKLASVQSALSRCDMDQMTVTDALGSGHELGPSLIYRGNTVKEKLLRRLKLEVVVDDSLVDPAVCAIRETALTGQVGDGIIWVFPLQYALHIRKPHEVRWPAEAN